MKNDVDKLVQLFERLGASNPEQWASSQKNERIPQLARYLFLRQAWKLIVAEGDESWIDFQIREFDANPTRSYAGVGRALGSLKARGATFDELTDLVRGMQAELLFQLCYLLEDSGDVEDEVADVTWGLFLLDKKDRPVAQLTGLHESVLETDPTGREMRPRK